MALPVFAGPRPGNQPATPYLQLGEPDQAEGAKALDRLRRQGINGDYYLEFQLRILPRRGEERTVAGAMWGSQNSAGTVSRVQWSAGGGEAGRLLIQNGPAPAVWRTGASATEARRVEGRALFEPLIAGSDITPFDLQMPFVHWRDYTYEGLGRFRGRPAHIFLLRPPAELAAALAGKLTGVRVQLDAQFNALVQIELLGPGDRVTKTTSLVDLKKVGEQWIVKSIDVRDELTRNKTRFAVTGAALGLDFSGVIFDPEQLQTAVATPDAARVIRFGD